MDESWDLSDTAAVQRYQDITSSYYQNPGFLSMCPIRYIDIWRKTSQEMFEADKSLSNIFFPSQLSTLFVEYKKTQKLR